MTSSHGGVKFFYFLVYMPGWANLIQGEIVMLDMKFIREHADEVKQNLVNRHNPFDLDKVLALDEKRRELLQATEALKSEKNAESKKIAQAKKIGRASCRERV